VVDTLVCNASPLILLCRVGQLGMLGQLADDVWVPRSVLREVSRGNAVDGAGDAVLRECSLVVVDDVPLPEEIERWQLGSGESQALAVARQRAGARAVLDDRAARRCAETLGVPVIGTLGLVALARQRAVIPSARDVLDELRANGLWISDALLADILNLLGDTQ